MPTRFLPSISALLAALVLVACSGAAEPAACTSDAQCPVASRCAAGVCLADARPAAEIRATGPVEAFALVELDGGGSRDPDRDDTIAEHLWTIRPVTAHCAAPEVASRVPVARVRFGCPGRFAVSLAVRDALGVESAPATVELEVLPSSLPPLVIAGPDVFTDHACTGEPLVCRPTAPVILEAFAAVPGATLRWSVEPPVDRSLADGTRRVGLFPVPAGVAAVIETDGTGISGDWIFRVEALDAHGVVGAAYTRVSVRNRAPVLVASAPAPFPHAYDAAAARFTSVGEVAWSVHDPDGDPIDVEALWRHLGDGGAPFEGRLRVGAVTFAVEVPYGAPEDALRLAGAPGLARTIELTARDPNRGEARAAVAVEIDNRPPEPAAGAVDQSVPHAFDAARSRYVAAARLGAWRDPDGDPIFAAAAGGSPCDAASVVDGAVTVTCSVPYEGVPAAERIAGRHQVAVLVGDPWSAAGSVVYPLEIQNRPPALTFTTEPATVRIIWNFATALEPVTFTVAPVASDPDGDPVGLTAVPAAGGFASPEWATCASPACVPFVFYQPRQLTVQRRSGLAVSDGAAVTTVAVSPTPI